MSKLGASLKGNLRACKHSQRLLSAVMVNGGGVQVKLISVHSSEGRQIEVSDTMRDGSEFIGLLREERDRLSEEESQIQKRLTAVRQELRAITTLIDLRESATGDESKQAELSGGIRNGAYLDNIAEGDPGSVQVEVGVEDILDCKTQREALYVIAQKGGRVVDANEAGDLIMAAGKSKGQRSTIISTAHRYMSTNPDFVKIGPSKFRLIVNPESSDFDDTDQPGPVDTDVETASSESA